MILYYYPCLLIFVIFFGIAKGFINFDEEFVIFLCLFIVFITLIETLGDTMNEYATSKVTKIKSWYFNNWTLHISRIKSNSELLYFIENFYSLSFYFFIKILNSFFYFISYNFYLKTLYNSLLIKEILYSYEILELQAIQKANIFEFTKNKEILLNTVFNKNKKFPIKTLKIAINKLK